MTETSVPPPPPGPRVSRDDMRDISRLRRARDGRMIAGVAEGASRHFDVDPILIRVLLGALTLFGGAGLALYGIAWLSVPEEGETESILSRRLRRSPERVMIAGLSIAAVVAALTMIGAIGFSAPNPYPVMVVSLAALVALALFSRRHDAPAPAQPATPVPPEGMEQPSEAKAWWQRDSDPGDPGQPAIPSPPVAPRPPRPPRARSRLFLFTLAAIAIALGAIWLLEEAGYNVAPSVYPGTALALVATGLIVGAWYGRSRLLILVGVLAALLTAAFTVVDDGPLGERVYRPQSAAEVRTEYHHGAGSVELHLEDVADVGRLDGRTIKVTSNVGRVLVVIPTSLDATVNADIDHGDIEGPAAIDQRDNGGQLATLIPTDDADPDVTIDVDLRFGQINLMRFDCAADGSAVGEQLGQSTTYWIGGSGVSAACN